MIWKGLEGVSLCSNQCLVAIQPPPLERMFGPGIYSTSISSKADDYAGATLTGTNLPTKIMILNHVALGKSKTMFDALHEMQHAPPMYNSVRLLVLLLPVRWLTFR